MAPLAFVVFQLLVLGVTYAGHARRDPSPGYRLLWLMSLGGVITLDVWYLVDFAYPGGFGL